MLFVLLHIFDFFALFSDINHRILRMPCLFYIRVKMIADFFVSKPVFMQQ